MQKINCDELVNEIRQNYINKVSVILSEQNW